LPAFVVGTGLKVLDVGGGPSGSARSTGWQFAYLVLGEGELDAIVDNGYGADRDGDLLLAPQVPFVEKDARVT